MSLQRFDAKIDQLDEVLAFSEEEFEKFDVPMKYIMALDVAIEEIFVNIAHYAYADGNGDMTLDIEKNDDLLSVEFSDSGMEFNPLEKDDPDITLSAEDRQIGGLGIFMVKKSMDDVKYRYENNKNILTLYKRV